MRIVFFGTPLFAVPFLEAIEAQEDMDLVGIYTQTDKPSGRGNVLTKSEVKQWAEKQGRHVNQPATLNTAEVRQDLESLQADVFVVVAFGKLIPESLLAIPPFGCINVHPSLLPLYRGPSPIQAPILNGDAKTGVSIMLLDKGMDTGPILAQDTVSLQADETSLSLTQKLIESGVPLLIQTLRRYVKKEITPLTQDETKASTTALIRKADGQLDWNQTSSILERKIRAYLPWPGAWTTFQKNHHPTRLIVRKVRSKPVGKTIPPGKVIWHENELLVGTRDYPLCLEHVQPEGKPPMSGQDFYNGYSGIEGQLLG